MDRRPTWTNENHALLVHLFKTGKSDKSIGIELGKTAIAIRDHRLKTGLLRERIKHKVKPGVIQDIDLACDALLDDLRTYCDTLYPDLDIPAERPVFVIPNQISEGSMIGSPASLCAEEYGSFYGRR